MTSDMPAKRAKKAGGESPELQHDRVGDLFIDVLDDTGKNKLRISFRRLWYSPPNTSDGEVDFESAAQELSDELIGGTLVLRFFLENGDLGYATEIPVASDAELARILDAVHQVYVGGLKYDNSVRRAAVDACRAAILRSEQAQFAEERRQERERRLRRRRGRPLLGRTWFRRNDRRTEPDRRMGRDRRSHGGRDSTSHQQSAVRRRRSSGGSTLAGGSP